MPTNNFGRVTIMVLKNILGVFLILFGIVGGFIPILQGWIFILLGISLLQFPGKDKLLWRIRQMKYIRPLAKKFDQFKEDLKKKRK